LVLTNSGASWQTTPLPGDLLVTGPDSDTVPIGSAELNANQHTGLDRGEVDFFVAGGVTESSGTDMHVVNPANPVPEPGNPAMLVVILVGISFVVKKRHQVSN
jgi:hypothetical protein